MGGGMGREQVHIGALRNLAVTLDYVTIFMMRHLQNSR
jgi:hypothetical protein